MKRKIVFVIVEGPSDDEALSLLLERIYERENVYVYKVRQSTTSIGRLVHRMVVGECH